MVREFNVVIEKDEDGYFVASVPALRGCHTQAKSLDIVMKKIREVVELCLEVEEPVSNEPEKRCYLHSEQHKLITHREAARFQSFPDSSPTHAEQN